MHKTSVLVNTMLLISLLFGMIPAGSVDAQAAVKHSFDDAALLMISSQIRLEDESVSAISTGANQLSVMPQVPVEDELDILIQLYQDRIARLRASDRYSDNLEQRLINELEDKVIDLNARAQKIAQKQNRRRGGILGAINRGFKWFGRKAGRVVGGLMEGAGKVTAFAIEEVGPQVLRQWLTRGAPLNAALVRRVVRNLLRDKLDAAIGRWIDARERRYMARDEDDQVTATDVADLLEAFEENDEETDVGPDTGNDGSTGTDPGSANADPAISFSGQFSFVCEEFVGEGGDSDHRGNVPLNVNFNTGNFHGEASFSHVNERGITLTDTYEYQGTVSQDGILVGTQSVFIDLDHPEVVGSTLENIVLGIFAEDASGVYLYTTPEVDALMLQAFEDGRDAVLSQYSGWLSGELSCR